MKRKKAFSADNQQERSKRQFLKGYVVGLVDGEGTFHVAFPRRKDFLMGISVIPEFHVSQSYRSKNVLELLKTIFGCGYIKANHPNSKDNTYIYVVRDRNDLLTKIIPYFEVNQLLTTKRNDFKIFAKVVRMMKKGLHLDSKGIIEIVKIAYKMNAEGKRRKIKIEKIINALKSSETIR